MENVINSNLANNNVVNFKIPTMLTIKETAQRCGIAEHFVRSLAINNKIQHVKCGKKYLVNLEKFVEYLNSATGDVVLSPVVPPPVPDNKYKIAEIKV